MLDDLRYAIRKKSLPGLDLGRRYPSLSSAIPNLAAWGVPRLLRSTTARRAPSPMGAGAAGPAVLLVLGGAALMYLLDPDRGAERRARTWRYLNDLWNRGRAAVDGLSDSRDRNVYATDRHRDIHDRLIGV
jgi:hypothetical protein